MTDDVRELGSCKGSFYRVVEGERVVASFQSLGDAIYFSNSLSYTTDIIQVDHYQNGITTTVVAHIVT